MCILNTVVVINQKFTVGKTLRGNVNTDIKVVWIVTPLNLN